MPNRKLGLAEIAQHFDKAIADVAGGPTYASSARSPGAPSEEGARNALCRHTLSSPSLTACALAGILGVCTTVIKKICRENGVRRWPQRKLKSIDKIMGSIECAMRSASARRHRYRAVVR